MEVLLTATGQLEKEFGGSRFRMEFPEGATLGDLLVRIDSDFGDALPRELWNRGARKFRGPVVLVSDGRVVRDSGLRLRKGQEIVLFKVLVGG